MRSRLVVVELRSSRMDVVAYRRGRRMATRRIDLDLSNDPVEWAKAVRRSAPTLRAAVEEFGVTGDRVLVLYRSPTQAVDLTSLDVRAAGQATEAARLGCIDALPYSAMATACEAVVVGRDGAGSHRQTHVVVAADRDDVVGSIVELVEQAGLSFESATPVDAAVVGALAGDMLGRSAPHGGLLYVGEQSSFFMIAAKGALAFERRIGIGLEALAISLTRAIRSSSGTEPVELDADTARRILHSHGIPDRDAVVHEELGLVGQQVLPLLLPVLQRFVVELRQSLRFGVEESARSGFPILLRGPGASIPGLAELVATELDVQVSRDERHTEYDFFVPGSRGGELVDALRDRSMTARLNLQPRALAKARQVGRLRRWMWTGAAAALAVIAADTVRFKARLTEARREAEVLQLQVTDVEALRQTGQQLTRAIEAMNVVERRITSEVGARPDYAGLLEELARKTPEWIRLSSIAIRRGDGGSIGTITGYAFRDPGQADQFEVDVYVDRLRLSPLFERVVLGTVQAGSVQGREGQRFEIQIVPVRIPRRDQLPALSDAGEDG